MSSMVVVTLLAFGCGSADEVPQGTSGPTSTHVGRTCTADTECTAPSTCMVHSDFGSGMCSRACASHPDCPSGSRCVQVGGGLCAVSCSVDTDCFGFPSNWVCGDEDVAGGQAKVCRVP